MPTMALIRVAQLPVPPDAAPVPIAARFARPLAALSVLAAVLT